MAALILPLILVADLAMAERKTKYYYCYGRWFRQLYFRMILSNLTLVSLLDILRVGVLLLLCGFLSLNIRNLTGLLTNPLFL